jgi:hypothetical protein
LKPGALKLWLDFVQLAKPHQVQQAVEVRGEDTARASFIELLYHGSGHGGAVRGLGAAA